MKNPSYSTFCFNWSWWLTPTSRRCTGRRASRCTPTSKWDPRTRTSPSWSSPSWTTRGRSFRRKRRRSEWGEWRRVIIIRNWLYSVKWPKTPVSIASVLSWHFFGELWSKLKWLEFGPRREVNENRYPHTSWWLVQCDINVILPSLLLYRAKGKLWTFQFFTNQYELACPKYQSFHDPSK